MVLKMVPRTKVKFMRDVSKTGHLTRRTFVAASVMSSLLSARAFAENVTELQWQDLLPEGQNPLPPALSGMVQHGSASLAELQPKSTGVRDDWNGKRIKMPGYIVPLDYDGTGVTAFILVPYVGACIHVPPPPANQTVYVELSEPFIVQDLYAPVWITGTLKVERSSRALSFVDGQSDIPTGYALKATSVEPYN